MTDDKPPNNDSLKASAGTDGVSVEIQGHTLGNVIADIFSPFSERRGKEGDRLKIERMQQWEAAASKLDETQISMIYTAANEALRIRDQRGITPSEKPPVIIDQFLENAPNADDVSIALMWGALLENDSPRMAQLIFIDLLKRIGSSEAHWVEDLWNRYDNGVTTDEIAAKK